MQKSPKKYWYQRQERSRNKQSNSLKMSKISNQESQIPKERDNTIAYLEKKAKKVNSVAVAIGKLEDFYQIVCGQELHKNMAVRCYLHNNEVILYCVDEKKLLCANCMFSSTSPNSPSKHANHTVKQTSKSSMQIQTNIKQWQFQLQQRISQITACELEWQKVHKLLIKTKQQICKELDKEYDQIQMQLSKIYLTAKNSIHDLSTQYEGILVKIIDQLRFFKKLIIPARYPVPLVKHAWLEIVQNLVLQLPLNTKEVTGPWIKAYQNQLMAFVKNFGR